MAENNTANEIWLTRQELAQRWKMPPATLAQWASQGRGPDYAVFGRHVRYALSVVAAFEASQTAARDLQPNTGLSIAAQADPKAAQ